MKKRTIFTRILCMALAMAMCLSISPVALAAETGNEQVMVETEAGSYEQVDVTVTIDTVTDADGNTSTQTTTEANNFITETELVVDYSGTSSVLTDPGGEILHKEEESHYKVVDPEKNQAAAGGTEITTQPAAPDVEVEIPMTGVDDPNTEITENQNTETTDRPEGTVIEVTGDVPENEADGIYDYTTSTVEKPGSATVTTTDITITETVESGESDLDYVSSDVTPDGTNDVIEETPSLAPEEYLPGSDAEPIPPEETVDGYEFIYAGTGNTSQFRPAVVFTEPLTPEMKVQQFGDDRRSGAYIHSTYYTNTFVGWLNEEYRNTIAKTEDGQYVTDEEGFILDIYGNRVLKEEKVVTGPDGETYYLHRFDNMGTNMNVEGWYQDGEWVKELNGADKYGVVYSTAQQFVLVDQSTGEVVTVYCADIATYTENGFGYNMENLEDAGYYTEEQAEQIRSIALKGYWGTVGYETDAEGNTVLDSNGEPVPKAGSLEALKETLRDSGEFTEEELESLTDGVALTATQMAIWSCSNQMQGVQFVNTHYVGNIGSTEVDKGGSNYMGNVPETKEAEALLMFKVYDFLRTLEPTSYEGNETTANTVINEQNFLKDMSLTVLDKAEGHANNQDTDTTNDAYVTNLSFALVVTPSTENGDDLVVSVLDSNSNVIARGRIAGEAQEGETVLVPDENGSYSFTGITLVEGSQNFNITLEGVQNLEEGIYLYTSEVRTDEGGDDVTSQTMVGLANGIRDVNVSMNIEFDVSVEDEIIVKERVWREEWKKPSCNNPPDHPKDDPPDNPPESPPDHPEGDSPMDPGEPEEVILAKPPKTGDGSVLYSILSALSGLGMGILQLLKKRKPEAAAEQAAAQEQPAVQDPPESQMAVREPEPAASANADMPQPETGREEVTAAASTVPKSAETGQTVTGIPESNRAEVHGICSSRESGVVYSRPIAASGSGAGGGTPPCFAAAPGTGAATEKTPGPETSLPGNGAGNRLLRIWLDAGKRRLPPLGTLSLQVPPLWCCNTPHIAAANCGTG